MTDEAKRFGIAHTDTVLADFMVRSAVWLLQEQGVPPADVRALDPFTGDGVFLGALVSHGVGRVEGYEIRDGQCEETSWKYRGMASIVNADAFSMKPKDVNLIIGNPPYGKCAKDAAVDARIRETYGGSSVNQQALYDGYVRAIRWASDVLKVGVIAYIVNSGFLDGVAFSNFRKCVEKEFSSAYVVDLRGNHRTSGERCRKEGGNVFGGECRTGVAVLFLVKKSCRGEK